MEAGIFKAEHKADQACMLWEVILEKAASECSPVLIGLLGIACDLNHGIYSDLSFIREEDSSEQEKNS